MKDQSFVLTGLGVWIALTAAPAAAQYFSTPQNSIWGLAVVQGAAHGPAFGDSASGSTSGFAIASDATSNASAGYKRLTVASTARNWHNGIAYAETRDVFTINAPGFGTGFLTFDFFVSGKAPTDAAYLLGDGGQAYWGLRYYNDNPSSGFGLGRTFLTGWALSFDTPGCAQGYCQLDGELFGNQNIGVPVPTMFGRYSYRVPVIENNTNYISNSIFCAAGVRTDRALPLACNLQLRLLGISKFESADGTEIMNYSISSLSGINYNGGTTNVPEPQTWISLIIGFGVIGTLARARRQSQRRVASRINTLNS